MLVNRRLVTLGLLLATVMMLAVGLAPAAPAQAAALSNLQAVNLGDQSATIIWDSSVPDTGSVKYGASCGALTTTVPAASSSLLHSVPLTGLTPATAYSYQAVSGDGVTTTGCQAFTTVQSSLVPPPPLGVVGHVYADLGSGCGSQTPLTTGIVTVTDSRVAGSSTPVMSSINSSPAGTYSSYFSPASTVNGSTWFSPQNGDTITVTGDAGEGLKTVTTTWDGTSNPVVMPALCVKAIRQSRLTPTAVGGIPTATPTGVTGRNSRITPTPVPVGNPTATPTPVPSRTPHPAGRF
jgi:hypothetical protein